MENIGKCTDFLKLSYTLWFHLFKGRFKKGDKAYSYFALLTVRAPL